MIVFSLTLLDIRVAKVFFFSPLALAGPDGSAPTGPSKEASVTEAGKRPVGRRRKGLHMTEHGAFFILPIGLQVVR